MYHLPCDYNVIFQLYLRTLVVLQYLDKSYSSSCSKLNVDYSRPFPPLSPLKSVIPEYPLGLGTPRSPLGPGFPLGLETPTSLGLGIPVCSFG